MHALIVLIHVAFTLLGAGVLAYVLRSLHSAPEEA